MRVAVRARMEANFPDAEAFAAFGGPVVLQTECARQLMAQGCQLETITFDAPEQGIKEGVWTMEARGERPERHGKSELCARAEHDECAGCGCGCHETQEAT